ncbi:hypothetical protein HPE56_08115 [Maribacter sp. ANRC-HE7]|uniref:Lumazine-binding n=1 Tax=Maribacter aquimaris TaxID=2737171 RepID=A0ABR7V1E9_9FLAO|nr:hypothetical protein [Maribacter aquimaris]MBD0777755.1 hypothetical protein [Maribacter aquimaris]
MKKITLFTIALLFIACAETQDASPAAIAKIVAESFYQGDEASLKKHTTPEGFVTFSNLQKMFAKPKNSESNFKVIDERIEGEIAWVKYSTSYDKTLGIFKLVKVNGEWKATARKPSEKAPF